MTHKLTMKTIIEVSEMKTKHMDLRMMQRGICGDVVTLVQKYGEFNARGDRILLTRKLIMKLLQDG
jgi:hypothetical protein